jgi:SAM-dependent methyltransferase
MRLAEFDLMYQLEDELWWYRGMRAITRALIERSYRPGAGLEVLDAGCGTGATAALLERYGRVTGIDVERYALRLAQRRPGPGRQRLACGSVTALPLPTAAFDLATCFDVLVMLDSAAEAAALAELARVLVPGGRLLLRVAAGDWLRGAHDRAWQVQRRYDPAGLRARLERAGLAVEHLSHANMWLFPVAAVKRLAERLLPPSDRSDLTYGYGALDAVFGRLLSSEARLAAGPGLPVGLSLFAVARK